jgi:hypothetical protein
MQQTLVNPSSPSGKQGLLDDARIQALKALALNGLTRMYDPETRLFSTRLRKTAQGLVREGVSQRYTMITLLGLLRSERSGIQNPFDSGALFAALSRNGFGWLSNIGDLGLLLWLGSAMSAEHYGSVWERTDPGTALSRYQDAVEGCTMHLSWFLAGLSHAEIAGFGSSHVLKALSVKVVEALQRNQGRAGFFGHRTVNGYSGMWRGWLGSFADQVYPIYALSVFSHAFNCSGTLEAASACAEAICRSQGELGQWWWHYSSRGGRVVGRYPVYSVHQDGMAPMALFALGSATGKSYDAWIDRGLQWIWGDNELDENLCDEAASVIWRSISRPRAKVYAEEAESIVGFRRDDGVPNGLDVLYECRPYHLGWLLYAFA